MKHGTRTRFPIALLLVLVGAACGETEPDRIVLEPMELDRGTVHLQTATDTFRIDVEIADTDASRAYGLMDREQLGPDEGMLFLFEEDRPGESGFYMYRTLIPLDAAFVDSDGTILAVRTMEPCPSPVPSYCTNYAPGAPYRFVLEVNGGYFESKGIKPGDRMEWER